MPTEYYLDESLSQAVNDLVADTTISELNDLRANQTAFLVSAMRKTNKDGDTLPTSGPPIVVRKIGPADVVFMPGFHFKVYVDIHRWDATNDQQHAAMVHRALLRIVVEVKETGVKYSTRRPDIETFQANVARYGAWEEPLILMRDNLAAAQRRAAELAARAVNKK
jgi:hypothetical protein